MKVMRGYTLIEVVIAITIFSIISIVAGRFMVEGIRAYDAAKPITKVAGRANIAADNLMRELQSAESISAVSGAGVTFVNQIGESIVITLSGANLTRSVNGGTAQTLCSGVTGFTLNYYNSALASTSDPSSVRFILLSLSIMEGNVPTSLVAGTNVRKKL